MFVGDNYIFLHRYHNFQTFWKEAAANLFIFLIEMDLKIYLFQKILILSVLINNNSSSLSPKVALPVRKWGARLQSQPYVFQQTCGDLAKTDYTQARAGQGG